LRANQEVAEVVDLVFAVSDRDVFTPFRAARRAHETTPARKISSDTAQPFIAPLPRVAHVERAMFLG